MRGSLFDGRAQKISLPPRSRAGYHMRLHWTKAVRVHKALDKNNDKNSCGLRPGILDVCIRKQNEGAQWRLLSTFFGNDLEQTL